MAQTVADPGLTERICTACVGHGLLQRIAALEAALAFHLATLPLAEQEAMIATRNARLRRAIDLILLPSASRA